MPALNFLLNVAGALLLAAAVIATLCDLFGPLTPLLRRLRRRSRHSPILGSREDEPRTL